MNYRAIDELGRKLTPEEAELLEYADSQRTILALVEVCGRPKLEVLRVLSEMYKRGILTSYRRRTSSQPPASSASSRPPSSYPSRPTGETRYQHTGTETVVVKVPPWVRTSRPPAASQSSPPPAVDVGGVLARLPNIEAVLIPPVPEARTPTPPLPEAPDSKTTGPDPDGADVFERITREFELPASSRRGPLNSPRRRSSAHIRGVRSQTTEGIGANSGDTQPLSAVVHPSSDPKIVPSQPVSLAAPESNGRPAIRARERSRSSSIPPEIGPFRIIGSLGGGNVGAIYLGYRDDGGECLAVRELSEQLAQKKESVEIFLEEARTAARGEHPNLVKIVEVMSVGDRHLLSEERINGVSLEKLLKMKPSSPSLAVRAVLDALSGLGAAHRAKDEAGHSLELLHCDLTPANVLVSTAGSAVLTDLGISKCVGDMPYSESEIARAKPCFSAPEQIRGELLDVRADVYGAGVLLWTALTGRTPFEGLDAGQIHQQVLHSKPLDASQVGYMPPECFDEICRKAMQKDREDRYASAAEMSEALQAVATAEGLLASDKQLSSWVRANFPHELDAVRVLIVENPPNNRPPSPPSPLSPVELPHAPAFRGIDRPSPPVPRPPSRLKGKRLWLALPVAALIAGLAGRLRNDDRAAENRHPAAASSGNSLAKSPRKAEDRGTVQTPKITPPR